MKKKIAILGSTGSIGKTLLNIVKKDKTREKIKTLSSKEIREIKKNIKKKKKDDKIEKKEVKINQRKSEVSTKKKILKKQIKNLQQFLRDVNFSYSLHGRRGIFSMLCIFIFSLELP